MELPKNHFKHALSAGKKQIGIWNAIADPTVSEILANCGYDWMLCDLEHTPNGAKEAMQFLRTIAPYPVSGVVRPSWNDPVEIKKLLDVGVQTLLVPYVQSVAEAEAAVAAVTYPPKGIRGVAGTTRAARYGTVANYTQRASEEICLLVQVETREAMENIEQIAQVDGVDGVFIGPADLAASYGFPGQVSHPEVKSAILDGIHKLNALGVPSGFLSLDPDLLREVEAAGAQYIAINIDAAILGTAARALRAEWD